uniref:Uncharacterized protein n=1 Tax=Rhizophora mucronata TaxID=61149 RepID=A0A2P2J3R1_RHIMU
MSNYAEWKMLTLYERAIRNSLFEIFTLLLLFFLTGMDSTS